jgi:hypothetical protein
MNILQPARAIAGNFGGDGYNGSMFFRRERPKTYTFTQRVDALKTAGFTVTPQGSGVRVSRGETAVDLSQSAAGDYRIEERAGILVGGEIGVLVDGGFQKFFQSPTGKRRPAIADQLRALHDFEEDLKESLGETSLYNNSLGTVSTFYQYDRVKDRDRGVPKRAWD